MVAIDVLLRGIPGWTNQGSLGQSTVAAVDGTTILDAGSLTRRGLLEQGLDAAGIDPIEIEHVLLTHLHWDHCDNLDLFPNATVHVYGPQLDAVQSGTTGPAVYPWMDAILDRVEVERFDTGPVVDGIEAIETPGHSDHHIAFAFDDEPGYLFAGDAIKNAAEFANWEYDRYEGEVLATYERLRDELEFVIPGHDAPFHVEDGAPVPAMDLSFGVTLEYGAGSKTATEFTSNRPDKRPLPSNVRDVAGSASLREH